MNTIPIGNWSLCFRNHGNGSKALGRNRIHHEYYTGRVWRVYQVAEIDALVADSTNDTIK